MAIDTRFTEPRSDQYARPMHVETAREARQGPLGRPILYVLIGGLALAAVYLIGTMIWSGSEDLPPAGQVQETTVPPAVNMTPADPVVIPAPAAAPAPVTPTPVTPAPVTPAG
jgi:hypothetical protein